MNLLSGYVFSKPFLLLPVQPANISPQFVIRKELKHIIAMRDKLFKGMHANTAQLIKQTKLQN
jgi:hypothetical protein